MPKQFPLSFVDNASKKIKVSDNVMSLLDGTFELKALSSFGEHVFTAPFMSCTALTTASELIATELATGCHSGFKFATFGKNHYNLMREKDNKKKISVQGG